MARATIKSQQIIIDQLSAQVAELTTQIGILMSQLEASNQARAALQDERDTLAMTDCIPQHFQEAYATLVDERNELIIENQRLAEAAIAVVEELDVAKERLAKQGQVIAAQPKSAPLSPKPAPKPLPVSAEVESQPTVEINDFDRAMYAKFKALPREQRLAIIEFARPIVGHVGIHNIVTVRAAWHESQAQSVA